MSFSMAFAYVYLIYADYIHTAVNARKSLLLFLLVSCLEELFLPTDHRKFNAALFFPFYIIKLHILT